MSEYLTKTYRCEWQVQNGTIDQYGCNFLPYLTISFPTREMAEEHRSKIATLNKFNGTWIPNDAKHDYCQTNVFYREVEIKE